MKCVCVQWRMPVSVSHMVMCFHPSVNYNGFLCFDSCVSVYSNPDLCVYVCVCVCVCVFFFFFFGFWV